LEFFKDERPDVQKPQLAAVRSSAKQSKKDSKGGKGGGGGGSKKEHLQTNEEARPSEALLVPKCNFNANRVSSMLSKEFIPHLLDLCLESDEVDLILQ
jgi:hypothetical protein